MAKRKMKSEKERSKKMKESITTTSCHHHNFNDDVLLEIFTKLPTKSLCRFKCVSKPWLSLIQDQTLIDKRRLLRPFMFEMFEVDVGVHIYSIDQNGFATLVRMHELLHGMYRYSLSHCNGLLCIYDSYDYKLSILNLTTGESLVLPDYEANFQEDLDGMHFEFCFDDQCHKYKVLYADNIQYPVDIQVLTMKRESLWLPVTKTLDITNFEDCVSVNGKLFWIDGLQIVFFNFSNNEFGEIDISYMYEGGSYYSYSLLEFEGYLCLLERAHLPRGYLKISKLWMLKDVDNKVWVLVMKDVVLPLKGTKLRGRKWIRKNNPDFLASNGEIVVTAYDEKDQYMFIYSFLSNQFKKIKIVGLPKRQMSWKNHVENYCSLKDLF